MTKVMLYAYTNNNFGDDLFIKTIIERYPDLDFYMVAPRIYKSIFKKNQNLHIYDNSRLVVRIISKIGRLFSRCGLYEQIIASRCDCSLCVGGSMYINEQPNWQNQYERDKQRILRHRPNFIIGSNFGPFMDDDFYNCYKELFKLYTDICFRDSYSYELFKDLGNVRLATDIVISCDFKKTETLVSNATISVINLKNRKKLSVFTNEYDLFISSTCNLLVNEGYKITLLSLCRNEQDSVAARRIFQNLDSKVRNMTSIVEYTTDIDLVIDIFRISQLVVATRFHAMILSFVLNTKLVPVIYSKKMEDLLQDLEFKGNSVKISDDMESKTSDIYKVLKSENIVNMDKFRKLALEQFRAFDEYSKCRILQ